MAKRNKSFNKKKYYSKDPIGVELVLTSGFTVFVKPLPPYYKEVIEDIIPMPEYPTRKIVLAAGDVVDWQYTPSDEQPDSSSEDYPLWMKWKSIDKARKEAEELRKRVRVDYLLSTCVNVLAGPIDVDNEDWVQRVEAAFPNFTMPSHAGKRKLIFLKTQVIPTVNEKETVINACLAQEVTMQGIYNALRGFQDNVGRKEAVGSNRGSATK